jgi:hypothetical protein
MWSNPAAARRGARGDAEGTSKSVRDMPAFDDHLWLRAEQRGRPQHEVGELRSRARRKAELRRAKGVTRPPQGRKGRALGQSAVCRRSAMPARSERDASAMRVRCKRWESFRGEPCRTRRTR